MLCQYRRANTGCKYDSTRTKKLKPQDPSTTFESGTQAIVKNAMDVAGI